MAAQADATGAAAGARKLASASVSSRHIAADAPAPVIDASRFSEDRPPDIHEKRPRPWHRYAYHVRTLPRALEAIAPELRVTADSRVLDFGCGVVAYRHFFPAEADYVAADLPGNPHATLALNPDGTVPVRDEDFDAVLSTQVLEHVTDPARYLSECFRVLRPGGRLLLSTHGTFVYHPDPDDYWRWTCAGLQKAVRDAGLEVALFRGIIGGLPTGLQLAQDAIYWQLPRLLRAPFALVMQTVIALSDRLHSQASRNYNAQVFALIAQKP
jgi:SAM-dependent methyltransferase